MVVGTLSPLHGLHHLSPKSSPRIFHLCEEIRSYFGYRSHCPGGVIALYEIRLPQAQLCPFIECYWFLNATIGAPCQLEELIYTDA